MKNRYAIMILLGALVVALIIIAFERPHVSRVSDVSDGEFIAGYEVDDVYRVEVSQLLDGAQLERQGDGWVAWEKAPPIKDELLRNEGRENPEAKRQEALESRISHALDNLRNLDEGILVSRSTDKRALYRVDVTGLHLKLTAADDTIIADVWIGNSGPDYGSTYVRRADEDEVYLVRRPLLGLFSPVAADWLPIEDKGADHLPR